MNARISSFIAAVLLACSSSVSAGQKAVINDPDGYTNLRAGPSTQTAIVGRVDDGQVFEFDYSGTEHATWVAVKLASGKVGYMHGSRVRLYASLDELQNTNPQDEINLYGRGQGIDCYPLARAAAKGDLQAMQRYFSIDDTDGAAAETHYSVHGIVVHLIGDGPFAKFLRQQTPGYLDNIREHLLSGVSSWPFEPVEYMKRNFPSSSKVLFR